MSSGTGSVFISYRHTEPDASLAARLATYLGSRGADVFLDRQISPGANWQGEIGRAVASARYFVVLLSPDSVRSDMVFEELRIADWMRRSGKTRILPVKIGGLRELPYHFGAILNSTVQVTWQDSVEILGETLLAEIAREAPGSKATDPTNGTQEAPIPRDSAEPVADPGFVLGGAAVIDSPYYIRRQADSELESALAQPAGQTILIYGPKQSGKSSLLARAYELAKRMGASAFYIDFQSFDTSQLESLAACLRALGRRIEVAAAPARPLAEYWDSDLGAIASLTSFLQSEVLAAAHGGAAICFDEVDRIFSKSWAQDFFSMIRSWHNLRAFDSGSRQLRLILTHSTDPGLWIRAEQSPFNVGLRLRLDDFDSDQVEALAQRYGVPLDSAARGKLLRLTGGQPYLVRLALWEIKQKGANAADIESNALGQNSPFSDHLHSQLATLERNELAMQGLREVIERGTCEDKLAFEWLRWSGLVSGPSRHNVRIRCELYRMFFSRHFESSPQFA